MEQAPIVKEELKAAGQAMAEALAAGRLNEADAAVERLAAASGRDLDDDDILTFRTMLSLERGQAMEALCYLNNLPGERVPELRALCLHRLKDPLWEGLAAQVAEQSPKRHVRLAMCHLLGRREQFAAEAAALAETGA